MTAEKLTRKRVHLESRGKRSVVRIDLTDYDRSQFFQVAPDGATYIVDLPLPSRTPVGYLLSILPVHPLVWYGLAHLGFGVFLIVLLRSFV